MISFVGNGSTPMSRLLIISGLITGGNTVGLLARWTSGPPPGNRQERGPIQARINRIPQRSSRRCRPHWPLRAGPD
jgi:hypothetical protein